MQFYLKFAFSVECRAPYVRNVRNIWANLDVVVLRGEEERNVGSR